MKAMMNVEQARFNMIEQQIRTWDVLDDRVLRLLALLRRENFVPPEHRALAFVDMQIPLPPHTHPSQCMLEPKVEARLLQELALQGHETVLEIGTGSGYMAALLASQAKHVVTLEIEPALARFARGNLQRAGITNVEVREADGSQGILADAPFDAILVSGAVASVPRGLLEQLKVGGRLAAIVGDQPVMQATFVTRAEQNGWRTEQPWDTMAPRLKNFPVPSPFKF